MGQGALHTLYIMYILVVSPPLLLTLLVLQYLLESPNALEGEISVVGILDNSIREVGQPVASVALQGTLYTGRYLSWHPVTSYIEKGGA